MTKEWVEGLAVGLFVVALGLLALIFGLWPDCTTCATAASTVSTPSPSSQPPAETRETPTSDANTTDSAATTDSTTPASAVTPGQTPQTTPPGRSGTDHPTPGKIEVTKVSPGCGDPAGGTRVQISGANFTDKAAVKFGDVSALDVKYISPIAILATVPPHSAGAVDISVQIGQNTETLSDGFLYKVCPGQATIFLLALLAGALGGALHSIRSFYAYVGNRELNWSWVPMYAFRPVTGAALAGVVFLCFNGGVGSLQGSSSRYWIVGLSALVGLFSQEAFEKLKQIAVTILAPVPPASGSLKPASSGTAALAVNPPKGPIGQPVQITGTGFVADHTTVLFGTMPATKVKVDSATTLQAVVPAPASPLTGTSVDVIVTVQGSLTLTLHGGFTYTQ